MRSSRAFSQERRYESHSRIDSHCMTNFMKNLTKINTERICGFWNFRFFFRIVLASNILEHQRQNRIDFHRAGRFRALLVVPGTKGKSHLHLHPHPRSGLLLSSLKIILLISLNKYKSPKVSSYLRQYFEHRGRNLWLNGALCRQQIAQLK